MGDTGWHKCPLSAHNMKSIVSYSCSEGREGQGLNVKTVNVYHIRNKFGIVVLFLYPNCFKS